MSHPDVDILIGSKDGKDLLVRCLESVYESQYDGAIHLAVVDNHSKDQSNFIIDSRYPQILRIGNDVDMGQAAALNTAFSKTSSPYVLILSQDAEIAKDFIARQVEFLEARPDLGSAAARVIMGHDSPGARRIDSTGLAIKGAEILPAQHAQLEDDRVSTSREVFGPAGAAAFWRRTTLASVRAASGHLFDEDLIMGHLDADVAWRARWLGFKCAYNPDAVALHQRGLLYARDRDRAKTLEALRVRNRRLIFRKNLLFDGWSKYGSAVRSSVRREWLDMSRRRGLAAAADGWLGGMALRKKMARQAAAFEERATATPEQVYKWVFFHRSFEEGAER